MNFSDTTLLKKLALVLLLKLLVLTVLWWVFVRDQQVAVDGNRAAAQLLHPAAPVAEGTHK